VLAAARKNLPDYVPGGELIQTATLPQPVDGVLLLDKPVGITSNAAIQSIKRLLRAAKAGHVGTLDPLASGLLPVCLGEATKFSTGTFGADKSYDAEILLGVTTTTGDTEGEVTSRLTVAVTREQVADVLRQFTGLIAQTPPMYSALKRAGKPLYAYARAGQTVAREPRNVTVHHIVTRGFAGDRLQISVHCSKGTYIRVLAEDIGKALGCGATLAGLRRTTVGTFDLRQAITLERLAALTDTRRSTCVLPVDSLVLELPRILLDAEPARRLQAGQTSQLEGVEITGLARLYDLNQQFLGLGEVQQGGRLVARRLLATPAKGPVDVVSAQPQAPKNA
jgi:tRNA pseudouridine55 synthase